MTLLAPSLRLQITIDGFSCLEPVSNGLLDAGDNVWVECHAHMFGLAGPEGPLITARTLIHGRGDDGRVRIRAGSRTANGGLWRGDSVGWTRGGVDVPGSFRVDVGTFDLIHGANALVVVPTIWRAHGAGDGCGAAQGWLMTMSHLERHTPFIRFWVTGERRTLLSAVVNAVFGGQDAWDIEWYRSPTALGGIPDGCDRPIGSMRYDREVLFPPNVLVLNYAIALHLQGPPGLLSNEEALHQTGPCQVQAKYRDSGAQGTTPCD